MSLAEELRKTLYSARSVAGQLGFRPHTVAIVDREYSGAHVGDGIEARTLTPLLEANGQPPKVHWLNDEQKTLAGFTVGDEVIQVGPITPAYDGIGTDLSLLTGADLANGAAHHLLITGPAHPEGALFRVMDVSAAKALRYMIRAKAVAAST